MKQLIKLSSRLKEVERPGTQPLITAMHSVTLNPTMDAPREAETKHNGSTQSTTRSPLDLDALSQRASVAVLRPSNIHTSTLARRELVGTIGVIHLHPVSNRSTPSSRLHKTHKVVYIRTSLSARVRGRAAVQIIRRRHVGVARSGLRQRVIAAVAVVTAALEDVQETEPVADLVRYCAGT